MDAAAEAKKLTVAVLMVATLVLTVDGAVLADRAVDATGGGAAREAV